jgi:amidase
LLSSLWQVGPLARRVEDLVAALPILAGPDGHDPSVAPASDPDPDGVSVTDLRVAVHTDNGVIAATPEVASAVIKAAEVVRQAGAVVDEARPFGVEQSFNLATRLFAADRGAGVSALLHMADTSGPSPLLLQLGQILHGPPLSPAESGGLLTEWDIYRATMLAFMQRYDAIVCPVNAFTALPHGTTWDADHLPGFSYTMAYNLTGWPAVVIRAGTASEDLPIGVQIVAAPWREDVALALAAQVEASITGP